MTWWAIGPWLVLAVLYGFCWGWDYGKRAGRKAGDLAHVACHEAQQAVIEQVRQAFLASVAEHLDIEAWEEEL